MAFRTLGDLLYRGDIPRGQPLPSDSPMMPAPQMPPDQVMLKLGPYLAGPPDDGSMRPMPSTDFDPRLYQPGPYSHMGPMGAPMAQGLQWAPAMGGTMQSPFGWFGGGQGMAQGFGNRMQPRLRTLGDLTNLAGDSSYQEPQP